MEIVALGDTALIVRVGDSLGAVLSACRKLEGAGLPGVRDIAPAFASVAVFFDSPIALRDGLGAVEMALRGRGRSFKDSAKPLLLELPVCYDAEFALDLDLVARHCGLSPNEVVERHSAARYDVRCVGFTPGFPFLGGLPAKLATP
ncbi:MAG: carboxyltransferase domain-containing protein, partial [Chthoniobacterales bacterium]